MFVVVILVHLLKLIHFLVNSSKYHFLALVNFIHLFSAHAPRGNQLRLMGSACINKKFYLYSIYLLYLLFFTNMIDNRQLEVNKMKKY